MKKNSLEEHEVDTEECFETPLRLLAYHGFWPPKNHTHKIELPHLFWRFITRGFAGNCLFNVGTTDDISDDFVGCFALSFFAYIAFIFTLNQNKAIRLVAELRDFSEFGKPTGLQRLIKSQKKYSYAIYIYFHLGTIIYGYATHSFMLECEKTDEMNSNICGLILPIYIPFKISASVKLTIMILQLVVVLYLVLLPGIIGTYLMLAMMQQMTLRLRQIRMAVSQLSQMEAYEERRRALIGCVRYHRKIIGYENALRECFGNANAVHLFLSAIIIGILNYKIYYKLVVKDIIHLLGWILSLILLCNSGQGLLDESTKLATDIYCLPWYDFDKPLRYIVQFYLMRTQKPIKVDAGIFYTYSNELLLVIFQSSFSYMTILNQFTSRTNSKMTREDH